MKVFAKINKSIKCEICGTTKPGKAVLIPISGTGKGYNYQAIQVHLDCIELFAQQVGNELLIAGRFPCPNPSSAR